MSCQGNILVDENGNAVLSDIKLESLMFSDDQHYPVHQTCWWTPRERLIVDADDDKEPALAPVSIPADIYAAGHTITEVCIWLFPLVSFWSLITG